MLMNVLEILVKMVEPVEMELVDILVNVYLDLLVKCVKQVGPYNSINGLKLWMYCNGLRWHNMQLALRFSIVTRWNAYYCWKYCNT